MADHAHDVMGHAAKVKASVVTLRKAGGFALKLGEKLGEFNSSRREHTQVSVHGENEFILKQGRRAPHGNRLLTHSGEPFADAALPQKAEHFLFNQPRQKQMIEQFEHAIRRQASVGDVELGNVGVRHGSNLVRAPARDAGGLGVICPWK